MRAHIIKNSFNKSFEKVPCLEPRLIRVKPADLSRYASIKKGICRITPVWLKNIASSLIERQALRIMASSALLTFGAPKGIGMLLAYTHPLIYLCIGDSKTDTYEARKYKQAQANNAALIGIGAGLISHVFIPHQDTESACLSLESLLQAPTTYKVLRAWGTIFGMILSSYNVADDFKIW